MRIGDRIAVMEDGRIVQIGTPEEIVTQPADDYVSAFFKGVDVTQVFSAGDICRNDSIYVSENADEAAGTVLETVRTNGQEAVVVIDKQGAFQGLATRDGLNKASKQSGTIKDAYVQDGATIGADAALSDVLHQVAQATHPVAVADGNGKYLGAVTKASLLQTLDRTG
jgi:glycine betaine/proline transport system ATP-binding protein